MRPHTPAMIKEMLVRARDLVADGEKRLVAQEARVANLGRMAREGRESGKLLRIMRHTQDLQVGHVKLLERELGAEGDADKT